jgi:hypothetical protein
VLWAYYQLVKINSTFCQHTRTGFGTAEGHLPSYFHSSLSWTPLSWLLHQSRSLQNSDWDWLISKVEKKIGHWCNRWLSIGGRYTLIKAALEGQPVYWMALAAIPIPVLNKLRKIIYNFLWSGNKDQRKLHLCNWETLATPKTLGGWGFKNIFHFNKALAANSLWRALTTNGIWSTVIKDKYFPYYLCCSWLRNGSHSQRAASQTWRNLVKAAPCIQNSICWKPGSGYSIVIGKDNISGLGHDILSGPTVD